MAPPRKARHRTHLAERLRELRRGAFGSGAQFAEVIGWRQTRVSKLETGAQIPTDEDLTQWVNAVGADEAVLAELRKLRAAVDTEYTEFREMYGVRGGAGSLQDRFGQLERAAALICNYEPALLPGLVQTGQYVRELLSAPASAVLTGATPELIEETVSGRMRRQEVLYQPGKQIQVVVGEAALRIWHGSVATLVAQLDRLIALTDLATVDLRVLPFGRAHPTMPIAGFTIHDRSRVFLETLTGQEELVLPDEVATYSKAFELIRDTALTGPDAVELIRRVVGELR